MAVLLLLGATLLQITLLPRIRMLQGSVDLVLLILLTWMLQEENRPDWRLGLLAGVMMGYASALPDLVLIAGYTLSALVSQLLHRRILQVRMLTMLTSLILGTLIIHIITLGYLWLSDNPISAGDAFNLITLPTLLLNLILLLPVNALITEFNKLISSPTNP